MSKQARKLTQKQRPVLKQRAQPQQEQLAPKRQMTKRIVIWSGVGIGLIILVLGMIKITDPPQSEVPGLTAQNSDVAWTKGNVAAQATLVEYSDFQCGTCAGFHFVLKRLMKEMGEDLRFVFRHFPLRRHANAKLAARSAEAAGRQGKFWEMHDVLFNKQKEWAKEEKEAAEEIFVQYAASLNLNVEQFKKDLRSPKIIEKINEDYQRGLDSGVNATPTLFLNGEKIPPKLYNYEAFKNLIKSKLNAP
ncbi:thioredoxin domain-containing protein [Candidatus Poribacteria bacterium]|nr:thioredoxin domain-containing protein [Candidatus Poribacteria bacterium]